MNWLTFSASFMQKIKTLRVKNVGMAMAVELDGLIDHTCHSERVLMLTQAALSAHQPDCGGGVSLNKHFLSVHKSVLCDKRAHYVYK